MLAPITKVYDNNDYLNETGDEQVTHKRSGADPPSSHIAADQLSADKDPAITQVVNHSSNQPRGELHSIEGEFSQHSLLKNNKISKILRNNASQTSRHREDTGKAFRIAERPESTSLMPLLSTQGHQSKSKMSKTKRVQEDEMQVHTALGSYRVYTAKDKMWRRYTPLHWAGRREMSVTLPERAGDEHASAVLSSLK